MRVNAPDAVDRAMRASEEEQEAASTAEEIKREIERFEQSKGLKETTIAVDSDSD